eukprot:TRINITY_DN12613_c0_g1_i3.p1 TRINITY_DN12613_c0_g1~~TRINITY_DN12613_c0_g1_i3.p1  ORF type:complete len:616 (-),score=52.87 TRINITY_DN12613_c0_g1_i3:264-2111(-)
MTNLFVQRVCAGTILLVNLAIFMPVIHTGGRFVGAHCKDNLVLPLMFSCMLASSFCAVIAAWLIVSARTKYLKYVAIYSAVNCMCVLMIGVESATLCSVETQYAAFRGETFLAKRFWLFSSSFFLCEVLTFWLVSIRMNAMAVNAMMPLFSRRLNWCMRVLIFVCILQTIFLFLPTTFIVKALFALRACIASVYVSIVFHFLWKARRIAQNVAAAGSECRCETARRALFLINLQGYGISAGIGGSVPLYVWLAIAFPSSPRWEIHMGYLLVIFTLSCNQIVALVLGRASTSTSLATRRCDASRQNVWQRSSRLYKPDQNQRWCEKVKELCGRGFTLEKLLDFYQMLGDTCMQHFVPSRSTTEDVVRGAVIPLSYTDRCAMATVMMGGTYAKPHKIVTHCWRMLFRDLVAAIVSDALGDSEFNQIAHLLERDIPLLRRWVKLRGAHSRIYWVCALSVNQHAGICRMNPQNSKDTVTAELYPMCECNLPKAFNTDAPVLENGKGISCEMNKFQDMIRFLSAKDRYFEQVVAIDAGFQLFSRAWCIAEISCANLVGMKQRLKIFAAADLLKHSSRLRNLKVEEMDSAIPEDKEEILASIPDKAAGFCVGKTSARTVRA